VQVPHIENTHHLQPMHVEAIALDATSYGTCSLAAIQTILAPRNVYARNQSF
jgi:hypothetical protein